MAEPMGERMKGVEVELKGLKEGQREIVARLDVHDDATQELSRKIDRVLNNQAANAAATKTAHESLQATVTKMQPDVQTVADIKKMGKWGKVAVGVGLATLTSLAAIKGWIVLNWNWFANR